MLVPATHLTSQSRDWLLTESQKRRDAAIERELGNLQREARWNAPMADTLARADARHHERRFTGAALTGFGALSS